MVDPVTIGMIETLLKRDGVNDTTIRTVRSVVEDDGMATMTQCKAALRVSRWTVERWAIASGARKINGIGRNGGKFDLKVLKSYQQRMQEAQQLRLGERKSCDLFESPTLALPIR